MTSYPGERRVKDGDGQGHRGESQGLACTESWREESCVGAEAAERWGRRRVRRQVRGKPGKMAPGWATVTRTGEGSVRKRVGDRGKGGLGVNTGDIMNS